VHLLRLAARVRSSQSIMGEEASQPQFRRSISCPFDTVCLPFSYSYASEGALFRPVNASETIGVLVRLHRPTKSITGI